MDDPTIKLLAALAAIAGEGTFAVVESSARRWESVTFAGHRHTMTLAFGAPHGEAAAVRLNDALGPVEVPLEGHLVADIVVVEWQRGGGSARMRLEALTVEDSVRRQEWIAPLIKRIRAGSAEGGRGHFPDGGHCGQGS